MVDSKSASKGGLEGVSVGSSSIGFIDGSKGELRYRGYLAEELARQSTFTEVCWLLWHGELPSRKDLDALGAQLRAERGVPEPVLELARVIATRAAPMDALRTLTSALCVDDVPGSDRDAQANLRRSIRITARMPTLVAAYDRLRKKQEPLAPRSDLSHGANFLYMLTGRVPADEEARIFDACLILHAEHGFNASTFAARVTASTLSDIYSAVTSAVGTLKGPLHGGANTEVMRALLTIKSPDRVGQWLDELFARGERAMGFGHRVYKVEDPRARVLKGFAQRMAEIRGDPTWYATTEKLESEVKARKGIVINVDLYSASTYYYMGIDPDLYTTIFAMARTPGWTAHVLEQFENNRLIRPESEWTGAAPRSYIALSQRA
jgi:citrate synthase